MTVTDYAFSIVRNWMVGGFLPNPGSAPSGCLVGTGSGAVAFTNTVLGSPLYPTWRGFDSRSGLNLSAEFEHSVLSGDITTGSIVREIGMASTSGGTLFFRSLTPELELFGSMVVLSTINITVN